MEQKATFTKKLLSTLLALLMVFSACYAGVDGLGGLYTAYAAEGDSAYTKQEVADLINAATAAGFTLSSSGDAWSYTADNGTALAAARAIFDYAVNTYRDGNEATAAFNSTTGLYNKFDSEFSSLYTNATAARQLVKNVLNPDGATVVAYESPLTKDGNKPGESKTSYSKGQDVSGTFTLESYPGYYASTSTATIKKTVEIQIDIEKYLLTFAAIEDIPSTVYTNVKYTYSHAYATSATVSAVSTRTAEEKDGCDTVTVTYYTPTIKTSYWHHLSGKPNKKETKDNTIRKTLLTLEKYFNEDLLAITKADMLAMSLDDITSLYKTTELMYNNINNADGTRKFSDKVLDHFNLNPSRIHEFMVDVYFAYRVAAAKYNIDNMNTLIGSEYNVNSYSQMSALYSKTSTAYNVVFGLDNETKNYLINEGGYGDQYNAAIALKATAESYNATLYDIMVEQRLEELAASMLATYAEYYSLLNKEDIENPSDAEVIGLDQKVKGYDSVLAIYPSYSYYRTYWTQAYEAQWADFKAKLAEVYEVRGLKAEFQTHYDYFMPILFTNMIVDLDNESLIALHSELDTKISELTTSYTNVKSKWGDVIANKIFTISYEGTSALLQNHVNSAKSTGKEAAKATLIARNNAQLDTIWAYQAITTVNFDNFASIKSTLTYFDYDLYDYVNGQGWLTSTETTKYAMVQTLLDRYHAFSTTDGKSFFNEAFTFADANGVFATRYAGSQLDAEGNQIGYPSDLVRDGADDNYVVTETELIATVQGIDSFITSRDFGALVGFVDAEDEEQYVDLQTYIDQMLTEMLFNDEMMNTLVGAIFPMLCEMIEGELIGALGTMDGARLDDNGIPWLDLSKLITDVSVSGELGLYLDTNYRSGNPEGNQKNFMEVFKDLGLYIFPATFAESLMMSNPTNYGVGTEIYETLKAAGRDWTALVATDDPDTPLVDETKALKFEWGVYDRDTFIEVMGAILDSILPLLLAVFTDKQFEGESSNAAIAYSSKITALGFLNSTNTWIRGGMKITIPPLNGWNNLIVPLFDVLGVERIPNVTSSSTGYDIADALIGTLLKRVDEILGSPLDNVLEILPNLVYFLSMDSVQEMINTLNINLTLSVHELDVYAGDGLGNSILSLLEGTLAGMIEFPVSLAIADLLDLYDLLGFEISDFNEVIKGIGPMLGGLAGGEEGGMDLSILENLPPIKQQEIIFCSDWTTKNGRVFLDANKGDLMYWFIIYAVQLLQPDENGNSLLTGLLGEMDPSITNIIDNVVYQFSSNPRGALAAIVELLNPVTYDLQSMDWVEGTWNYNGIAGTNAADMVYLSYSNDWTEEKANYLVDEIDTIVANVLEMVEMDLGEYDTLGAYLQGTVNDLFTNELITEIVVMLGGLGDSPSAVINDVVKNQVGIDIESWFTAFGYLFPAETWSEDAEIILPGTRGYVNDFGVDGIVNEDGSITWTFNRMPLNDGDAYTFVNILTRLLGPAELLLRFLFAGEDVSAFQDLVTLKGYETYSTTLGLLFEVLGVENLPSQADFDADTMGSFSNFLFAVLDWFYALTDSDDMVAQLLEVIPDLFYYIESNGLSVLLHNLLMPVLVLVDTVRPLINLDVNGVLSLIVSELVNYGTMDINVVLQYIVSGVWLNDDLDYKFISIDIKNLRVSDILVIVDNIFGTNLAQSNLVTYGVTGLCSGVETVNTNGAGTINKTTVTAADAITIILTGLLESLEQPAKDETKTNGEVIFAFLGEMTESETIADLYPTIKALFAGIEVTYTEPNWGYMLPVGGDIFTVGNARETISYLAYTTDWTPAAADALYASLDEIIAMIAADFDGNVAQIVNSMLNDKVYSDANLNMIVEAIVNLFVDINASLFDLVDVLIDTDIASWFAMCEETIDETTGETKLVCTKNWGVDEAEDKRATFVAALKEVLAPANAILEWLLIGNSYAFFTGAEKNADGEFIYNDVITINGGEAYDYAIVPLFKALGIELSPAASFSSGIEVVEAVLNGLFNLIDSLTSLESTIGGVIELLPNIIYFLNADGIKTTVNNLLAPINGILDVVGPLLGDGEEISIAALLGDTLPLDITNITTEAIIDLLSSGAIKDADGNPISIQFAGEGYDLGAILSTLYVGELASYEYADGLTGYTLDVTGAEGDVLTLVASFALELFNLNADMFTALLGDEAASIIDSILSLLEGYTVTYTEADWAYMYDGDLDKLAAEGFPAVEFTYLAYANEWDEPTAEAIYDSLDEILAIVMEGLADGNTIAQLLNGVISDNLYTDANLTSIVELLVNAITSFDASLLELVGAVLSADIDAWFTMCEKDAEGKYVCTKSWGVDAATDKKAAFVAGIKEVLAPADKLLSWLFFGEAYTFFNGSDGEAIITLEGGEGYEQGLAPIFEALGCTMQPAESFYDAATDTYDVGAAVASILDAVLALVDTIGANPIEEVFALIPNLLYFINAGGLTTAVSNLLAPVNAVLAELSDVVGADNLQTLLATLINFDLGNLGTDAVFALLASEVGFITNAEMIATVKTIYGLGVADVYTSVNGNTAYCVDITGREYDVLTVILAFALDAFKLNGALFSDLLGAEQYQAVLNLLTGATDDFDYADINWAYMYDGDLAQLANVNGAFPERTGSAYTIYTQYQNNWNKATADYLNDVLDTLVQEIVEVAKSEDTSLGKMLDNAITNGLYSDSILNSLIEAVVGALVDYEEIIIKAGVLLDAQGLAAWFNDYCTVDEQGNVTVTKNWGINSAATNEAKRAAFVEGFVEALQPAYRLLAWLLFEKDFEFLTDYAGADHITISGGAGYDEAFVPLLEALGATMKPASAYTDDDGNVDMENVVRDIFTAVTDILYAICGDLQKPGEKGTIGTMLDLLPNVIYFINAGGVKAVVNNLLAPVNFILNELKVFGVNVDFATLIEGIDITNLDWYAVFDILEDYVSLYFPDFTQEFLATLYMGKAEAYTSANGKTAYKMVYTEEESRRDMITVVISFVGDAFVDARNKDQLVDWMGEDIYQVILTYLSGNAVAVEVQEFDWLFTNYAGTGEVLSPMLVGSLQGTPYGKYFKPEMGRYMEENLPDFVDTVIELLGIEIAEGEETYASLEEVLDAVVGDTIYTKANLDAIVTAIPELIASLKDALGEDLFTMISEVLNRALGIDLTYWNDYRVSDIEDGNREQFVSELIRVLKPTYPILAWLLTGEDLIALFHSADGSGRDMIVVEGAEGYAFGIIPLMEALACENIRTPDEFKLAADGNPENMLRLIIDPILDKVDAILADPVNVIFEVLPAVIYFLNSNGLDTVIKNTANAIFAVLENLEPAIGELNVYELIGFNPTELNINTMIEQLLADLEESTGLTFKDMAMDAIVELTVGEVVEFTSKNGKTAYTMQYASAEDRADMTSVILRFAMNFIAVEENARSIKLMLKDSLSDDGYKFVCALLDNFVDMAKTADGMDKILYTIYYIYVGAKEGADGVDGALDDANDNYGFMQDLLANSDTPFLNDIAGTFGDFMDKNFDDIVDSEGIVPNGFIKFFQSLTSFFQKIINWFKGMFG